MHRSLRALFSLRPRALTLIVFVVAAATIALANLSFDEPAIGDEGVPSPAIAHRSYGWPIIWHRIVLLDHGGMAGGNSTVGWYYSVPRLAANLVLWLILLTASSGACEWLMRRYRPGLRWSLRTLLVFVALVAGLCAWYAKARDRAALQDEIIGAKHHHVFVERWGPKWLDLFGMDRYRRRVVDAEIYVFRESNVEELLPLARLPDLRSLSLSAPFSELPPPAAEALGEMRQLRTLWIDLAHLTPRLPAALGELRELRSLTIQLGRVNANGIASDGLVAGDDAARLVDESLAAIGQMTHLEKLSLLNLPMRGESLTRLSHLKNLKALEFLSWDGDWNGPERHEPKPEDCLRAIATLTQLEWLTVKAGRQRVPNESLAHLAGLTELKTLRLALATDDAHMLSYLPPLPRLEALDLTHSPVDDDDLRHLSVLRRLRSLSFDDSLGSAPSLCTCAGLAELAAAESLEELRLEEVSPEQVLALRAIKRLKRLHIGGCPMGAVGNLGQELTLDDGETIYLFEDGLEEFRRALAALRESNPGIIVDSDQMTMVDRTWDAYSAEPGAVGDPERPSSWLPGGDTTWMAPLELAKFKKAGGRASFSGATWPGEGDRLITVDF